MAEPQRFQLSDGRVVEALPQGGYKVISGGANPLASPKQPFELQQLQGQAAAAPYAAPKAALDVAQGQAALQAAPLNRENTAVNIEQSRQSMQNQRFNQKQGLRQEWFKLPIATNFGTIAQKAGIALTARPGPAGDLAILYAFASVQDPASVVRESEVELGKSTAARFEALKQQYNMNAAGSTLPKGARPQLLEQIRANTKIVAQFYGQTRNYYGEQAKRDGFNPVEVVGPDPVDVYNKIERNYIKANRPAPEVLKAQFNSILEREGPDKANEYLLQHGLQMEDKAAANRPHSGVALPDSYANSYVGQGISGANEGLAGVLGAPVDLMTGALNLIPKGINAVANTHIPELGQPFAGGEWWKNRLSDAGSILPQSGDPSKQFVRRVGESVGASAVPGLAMGGSIPKIGASLLSGLGGGIGGATAQQVAPGNPLAEMAGELVGGGATGFGLAKAAQRSAQRGIESAIPTVDDLKLQAKGLYNQAENNGVVASPTQTRNLAKDMHATLRNEGQIGPTGKITDADTSTSKAFNLVKQYAGKPMTPKEMNTVRTVLSEGRQSQDAADQRLSHILLDQFDNWAAPMAPEFGQARAVSARYLQAQDLERARELAGARASQFTGSGFENALRTEYRGLDRGNIKGQNYFAPEVTDAIEKVARGTPTSNALRGIGRLAPTGPVSGMGSLLSGMGVGAMAGSPTVGGMFGVGMAGAGIGGRIAATRLGVRGADQAELIARNGGAIDQAELLPQQFESMAAYLAAVQQAKYLQGR